MPTLVAGLPTGTIPSANVAEGFARVPSAQIVRLQGTNAIVPFTRPPAPVNPSLPDPAPILGRTAGASRILAPAAVGGIGSAILTTQAELIHGQSLQNSIAIGAADGLGTFAGQAIGGTLGSAAGPIGTAVGAAAGGLIGGMVARELARSLLPKSQPPIAEPIAAADFTDNDKLRQSAVNNLTTPLGTCNFSACFYNVTFQDSRFYVPAAPAQFAISQGESIYIARFNHQYFSGDMIFSSPYGTRMIYPTAVPGSISVTLDHNATWENATPEQRATALGTITPAQRGQYSVASPSPTAPTPEIAPAPPPERTPDLPPAFPTVPGETPEIVPFKGL